MSEIQRQTPAYSPESFGVNWIPTDTLRDQVNGEVYAHGAETYVNGLSEQLAAYPAYNKLVLFTEVVSAVTKPGSRISNAFLDGGAIALDTVRRFLPHLMRPLDTKMSATLTNVEEATVMDLYDDSLTAESRFTQAIYKQGEKHYREHSADHVDVLAAAAAARNYEGVTTTSLRYGFGFVMEQASRTYREDLKKMRIEAVQIEKDAAAALKASHGNKDLVAFDAPDTWLDLEIGRTILAATRQNS